MPFDLWQHGIDSPRKAGISAVAHCPNCGNAILDWDVAQQVEELVQPLFNWSQVRTHTLPKPVVSITFPELHPALI